MSGQVSEEDKALGLNQEELQGLIEYLGRSFFRAYYATASVPWDFQLNLADDVRISDNDKTDIAFHLGRIRGFVDALRLTSETSADHGILDKSENVKRFITIMSGLAKLYQDYSNDNVQESKNILESVIDVLNRLEIFYRDFMVLLRTEG